MIRTIFALAFLSSLAMACGEQSPNVDQPTANAEQAREAEAPKPAPRPEADIVRVRLETEQGAILLALDHRHAPITTKNFLRYVDSKRFDDVRFYRAASPQGAKGTGFIQGGIQRNYRRMFEPIAHEPTGTTGLRHGPGTISMARLAPGTAAGEFIITVSAQPGLDQKGDNPGFAAFGRVVEGMDVVRRIHSAPVLPNAGRGPLKGQMIAEPVKIVTARRVD
jgi:peptidyl-prolyl cis-trans isomerase A (cyclophilin A)